MLACASTPATSGVATLVPPSSTQPSFPVPIPPPSSYSYESYTETGDSRLATAATSLSMRLELSPLQSNPDCHAGCVSYALQPPPLSFQTVSSQPRSVFSAFFNVVPPTEITSLEAAG